MFCWHLQQPLDFFRLRSRVPIYELDYISRDEPIRAFVRDVAEHLACDNWFSTDISSARFLEGCKPQSADSQMSVEMGRCILRSR